MDGQRTILLCCYMMLLTFVLTAGCGREKSTSNIPKSPKVPGVRLFDKFDHTGEIEYTEFSMNGEAKCRLRDGLLKRFKSAFDDAAPEPNTLKWQVIGKLEYHSDGKNREAFILDIGDDEAGLRLSSGNYWRGIKWKVIEEVIRDCDKR